MIKTWGDVEADVAELAARVRPFDPDLILGLGRGGAIPAHLLAMALPCRHIAVAGWSYKDDSGGRLSTPRAYAHVALTDEVERVVVLDDVAVTGRLLHWVATEAYPHLKVCSAALYRLVGAVAPDIYITDVEAPPVMPWEADR